MLKRVGASTRLDLTNSTHNSLNASAKHSLGVSASEAFDMHQGLAGFRAFDERHFFFDRGRRPGGRAGKNREAARRLQRSGGFVGADLDH
jgi:hypothetical protein